MDIGIDLGKRRSYVVMQDGATVVKEGYTETTKEGFDEFFGDVGRANLVVESSSSLNRVASLLEGEHNITVANPMRVKLIAQSVKKTDKIDAHILLDLFQKDYLPTSHLPPKKVRDERTLCRNRSFLVRQRAAVKNRIRGQMYDLGIEFGTFTKRNIEEFKRHPEVCILAHQLESFNELIYSSDSEIEHAVADNKNAQLIDTIPGIGKYGALTIVSEIDNVSNFASPEKLCAYGGLVPRVRQSGDREWKGRIIKGNVILKTALIECVQVHIRMRPKSFISRAYFRIRLRKGHNKAKIAAARRLLEVIYFMLKRNEAYRTND